MTDKVIKVPNGQRYERNGWIRMKIWGGPRERGKAYGRLIKAEMDRILEMQSFVMETDYGYPKDVVAEVLYGLYMPVIRDKYSELADEMEGIVEGLRSAGSKATIQDVLLWNLHYTLDYVISHVPELVKNNAELDRKYGHVFTAGAVTGAGEGGAKDRCSAFIAVGDWTKDGKIVCAHNTFDNFIDSQYCNVILDVRPSKGNAFIMQTAPGQIASGTDYYVTSNGFIVTETTIGGFIKFKLADPVCCRIRRAVQYSRNLDDYVMYLEDGNGGDYANSWLVGDTKNNQIMRIELGLDYKKVEKKKNGYFIGYNAPTDGRIRNLECINTGYYDIRRHQGARRVRLGQLMEEYKGRIDVDAGQRILADHYDVYLNKVNMCSRTCCSHYELDNRAFMSQADRPKPFQPRGAIDGIVSDSSLAKHMALSARWGTSCGTPFYAKEFCQTNKQWAEQEPYLNDRPHQPWTVFKAKDEGRPASRRKDRITSKHRTRKGRK